MYRKSRFFCLILSLVILLSPLTSCTPKPESTDALRLSENGKSAYRVVISESASADVVTIAEEFVGYFEKITGVTLEIVRDNTAAHEKEIVIGRTTRSIDKSVDYDRLNEEGLVYCTAGNSLLLTGGSDRGVAYSVYGFLEDYCGVRYWSPTYETVPETETLEIPNSIVFSDEPVFWFRTMNEAGADDSKWMVKMRLNSCQSLGSERYKRTPFVGGGHGYAEWFVHTIAKLAEMDKNDSSRTSFTNIQPCLTDETVYQTVLKNVRAWLDTYPAADIISISQNDGTDESAMCTCFDCKAIYNQYGNVQSALWIHFVSRIANELSDEYPDVYFDTLAYNFTSLPPSGLEIPENMIVRIAPAHACINHSYKDTLNCLTSASPEERASSKFANSMAGWKQIATHRFIWDYDALFYNYLAPQTNFDYIYENISNYAEDGIEGVFLQGDSTGSNGFSEMRAYLVAKMLWNPNMSEDQYHALMDEFMEGYYGEGTSEPLGDFIDLIEEKNQYYHFSLYGYQFNDFLPIDSYTDEEGVLHLDTEPLIDPMNACFDRAEALVSDETQKLHLRKARMQAKYYEAMARFWIVYEAEAGQTVEIDYDYRKQLNTSLYEDAIACGIQQLSEGQVITSTPNLNYAPLYWDR